METSQDQRKWGKNEIKNEETDRSTSTQPSCVGEEMTTRDPRCHLELGNDVYVTIKMWKDELGIHIRKYDANKGKPFPTQRGIKLGLVQWLELKNQGRRISETITELKSGKDAEISVHLGANIFVNVNKKFAGVDIRQWWWCEDAKGVKPSRRGIFLRLDQWEKLEGYFMIVENFVPELSTIIHAGFIYENRGDTCVCFKCKIHLKGWMSSDDPWVEHEKWSPNCEYLRMVGVVGARKEKCQDQGFSIRGKPELGGNRKNYDSSFWGGDANLFAKPASSSAKNVDSAPF